MRPAGWLVGSDSGSFTESIPSLKGKGDRRLFGCGALYRFRRRLTIFGLPTVKAAFRASASNAAGTAPVSA